MPTIANIDSIDLSRFEFCPLLPILHRSYRPIRRPIRDALKYYFHSGGKPEDFLNEAASPGFVYPEGEPFVMANDGASWLDGALRLRQELIDSPFDIWRAGTDLNDRWDTLLPRAFNPSVTFTLRLMLLPRFVKGRLLNPLSVAFEHPLNHHLRLAPRDGESFGKGWRKVGRWESGIDWREWRRGIELDKCLERCLVSQELPPIEAPERITAIAYNIERELQKPLQEIPLRLEVCPRCVFGEFCHGNGSNYVRLESGTLDSASSAPRSPQT